MRRTEALQGVRMAVFLNILNRWESAELNQEEAAELLGGVDAPDGGPSGGAHDGVFESSQPMGIGGAEPGGGGRVARGD